MQLICRNDVKDVDAWKRAFDADWEARSAAGLSLLQIWRDADVAQRVFLLFEVNDKAKAEAFVKGPRAGMHAGDAGVLDSSFHFVETL